jgi:hypothetical protein
MSICFITAIYGSYEKTCKKIVRQTIDTDFICFTDNKDLISNGWIIDTTPYHLLFKNELDNGTYVNSQSNNKHTFNIAKYYKQSFNKIPILDKYDVVVWLDGTIEIIYNKTSEYILSQIYSKKIIGWNHEDRRGRLEDEVKASHFERYTSTHFHGQDQPYQDIDSQYKSYLEEGYTNDYFKQFQDPSHTVNLGMWITCFVAFLKNDPEVKKFLDLWYLQTLKHTTQDQISFPYVCQKTGLIPFTLPNKDIYGIRPHFHTQLYIRHKHGV